MLRRITLEGFKRFSSLDLPLAPLTLLSGTNSGGKSTIIQSLALLAQNFEIREWERDLLLDGPELALGTVADVLNQQSGRRRLKIGCASDQQAIEWTFEVEDRQSIWRACAPTDLGSVWRRSATLADSSTPSCPRSGVPAVVRGQALRTVGLREVLG